MGPRQGEYFVQFLCDIWGKYRCLGSIYCTWFEFFFLFLQRTVGENAPSEEISDGSNFLFDIVVKYILMKICMKNNDTRSWVNRKHCNQPEIILKKFQRPIRPFFFITAYVFFVYSCYNWLSKVPTLFTIHLSVQRLGHQIEFKFLDKNEYFRFIFHGTETWARKIMHNLQTVARSRLNYSSCLLFS